MKQVKTYTICTDCGYHGATKELHPISSEVFTSCSRCGYWRQYLDKKTSSVSTMDTKAFIEETDLHYIVGGGGKGAYCIRSGDELEHLGSLDDTIREGFEKKAMEMWQYGKADHITYTQKQLGVWFEFDFIKDTKRELKDDDF